MEEINAVQGGLKWMRMAIFGSRFPLEHQKTY